MVLGRVQNWTQLREQNWNSEVFEDSLLDGQAAEAELAGVAGRTGLCRDATRAPRRRHTVVPGAAVLLARRAPNHRCRTMR